VAGEVARLLEQKTDEDVQRQALETLIAMRAPGLFEVLVSLARSSPWPVSQERAGYHLAEAADYSSLMELPNDLKPVVYRAALRRDVRFRPERFGHKVVFANGRRE